MHILKIIHEQKKHFLDAIFRISFITLYIVNGGSSAESDLQKIQKGIVKERR